ncbi:MAG TPA: hypothetical protein VE398_25005 [Acidobacteriota bacterium]|nr:hypothetical protein [Acidobacteriota bacterium]
MRALAHVRGLLTSATVRQLSEQIWHTKVFLGLSCDISVPRPLLPAKIPVVMEPCDAATFRGFHEELEQGSADDYPDIFRRMRLCRAGLRLLYIAWTPDRKPAFAQWLIRPADQAQLQAHKPRRFPVPENGEVLLEGAHTFARFRGMGAMRDGVAQTLRIAQSEGYQRAITYVAVDNAPSLRSLAHAGFAIDHLRGNMRRFGHRRSQTGSLDGAAKRLWHGSVGARSVNDSLPQLLNNSRHQTRGGFSHSPKRSAQEGNA